MENKINEEKDEKKERKNWGPKLETKQKLNKFKLNSKWWCIKKITAKDKKIAIRRIRIKLNKKNLWNKMQRDEIETKINKFKKL